MHSKNLFHIKTAFLIVCFLAFSWENVFGVNVPVGLTLLDVPYTQDFNTLASSGTSSVLPDGWYFLESGSNANTIYRAGYGSDNMGDTYSFGSAGSAERALGMLQSGTLVPMIGAAFANNTGHTVDTVEISYTGEQWRLGATGRANDRLDFQYAYDAQGAWYDVNPLDFTSPVASGVAGALDGNSASASARISYSITDLSIPSDSVFWIRWTDLNVFSNDDGLAVDDFSLTLRASAVPEPATLMLLGAGLLGLLGIRTKL